MKSLRYLVLAMILLIGAGCKDHKETVPDEISEILGLKINRPLEVAFASPQGKTTGPEDYESVSVVFNQPMKALSAEAPPIAEPFRIEPKTEGRFRWKGTATVSFEPKEPLKFGTEYKVTVPAGLAAPGGKKLEKDYTFSFTTPGPRLVSTRPATGATLKPGDPILFLFDQSVDPRQVPTHLVITNPAGLKAPAARALTPEELKKLNDSLDEDKKVEAESVVAVEPQDLPPDTTLSWTLQEGILGKGGPIGGDKPEYLQFKTLGPLKWQGTAQKSPEHPESGIPFIFNNNLTAESLKKNVKVSPAVEIPISSYDAEDNWNRHSLYLALEPNTTYTFTVSKDLTDSFGQKLGKDVSFQWKTSDRSSLSGMADGIAVLEAKGPLTIPIELRNIEKVSYRMVKLNREQVVGLLRRQDQEWLWGSQPLTLDQPYSVQKSFKPEGPRNESYIYNLDLKEALKGSSTGFVYYQVDMSGGGEQWHRRGLAQVTNLGTTGKFSPQNSLLVATDLDTAKPVSDVTATILDPQGRPVWRGTTDKDGMAKAPGWSQLLGELPADDYSSPGLFVFLKKGADEAFIQNSGFGEVYSWQFDVPQRWSSSSHYLKAEVYSERGLYRPNETVHLKGSLRDRDNDTWSLPQIKELSYVVRDSRDNKIAKGKVTLSEFGTFHHDVVLNEKSPTGAYRVDYDLDPALAKRFHVEDRVAGATFRVEEFEAAQFKVDVSSDLKAAVMGGEVPFKVSAQWLFGAPMVDTNVDWDARVEPAVYSSKDYPGYRFGPQPSYDDDTDDSKVINKDKATTSNTGEISTTIKLEGIPYRGDADLVLEGTVQSPNRRSITGSMVLPVARGEFRIGLKPSSTFLPTGQATDVSLVTLNPDGSPVGGKSVKVELIQRDWNSVKKTDVDGSFRWVSEVHDTSVWSGEQSSAKDPTTFKVTPKDSGYYIVRASAKDKTDNEIVSETSFYAYGDGAAGWRMSDDDTVELVPDKAGYAPGETAHVLIKNTFSGEVTALVTYERDKVLKSYTTTVKGGTPVIDVPLTEDYLPNLFVSVMLFRGRVPGADPGTSNDEGKPAFKMGYINLPVAPDSKRLKVVIETDKDRYGPKDEVVARLKVTDSEGKPVRAELSVTAADVGVLNLINFKTPDLFDTYYGTLPLSVRTSESRRDVIGQRSYGAKGEDQGGGGGYNPGFRKDFKFTAVWEPSIVTDSNGAAEVRFELPENLTTFRLMATAITADTRCGAGEKEIISSKPLLLKTSGPAFARLGDDFMAGVLVANTTDKGGNITVTLESDGVESAGYRPKQLYLKANEEREVLFPFKAEKEGTATLRFSAESDLGKDGIEYSVLLQQDAQSVNLAQDGHLDEGDLKQPLEIPSTVRGKATLTVKLSSSILLGLEQSVQALLDYPYGCLEQRLSRMSPLLLSSQLVERFELPGWNQEKVKVQVQKSLDLIPGYANTNGGLMVWPDSKYVHPLLTAQALSTAKLAEKQGYKINGNWEDKARAYLKSYLDGQAGSTLELSKTEKLVAKAAALDALTQYGFSGKSYLSTLMDSRSKMPPLGKAYLLKAAYRIDDKSSVKTLGQELTNSVKLENATAYFEVDESLLPWLFSSDIHDTGVILEALLTTEQPLPIADKVVTWLLEARNTRGTWGTTANNSAALAGLVAYANRHEAKEPTFEVKATLDGKDLGQATLDKKNAGQQFSAELAAGKHDFALSKQGDGRLYYSIASSYQDTKPSPAVDEGLTVIRSVTDLDGRPVGEFQGGKLYKVTLSVIAPDLRRYVVLNDPIPAGLSVVKTDFATESSELAAMLNRGNQPSWMTFHRFEDYNDKVLLFADALAPGEHTYEYLVRAQTPGTYLYPAAQAEEMYHPELFGRTSTKTVRVK